MAVVTIGAASLAPIFQELCDRVSKAMEKTTKFKPLLGFLQATLNSFRDRIIQPVLEGHEIFYDQDEKIEYVVVELQRGAKLIGKVAKLRSWSILWLDDYAEKLLNLDRYFRLLLETIWVREFRVVRQQNIDINHMMDGMLRTMYDAYRKAVETEKSPLQMEAAAKEERGSGEEEEEAALAVFLSLFEAVREAVRKGQGPWMVRHLVSDIESTMYSLQPFVEEMAACNRVLNRPREEVRSLKVEMEKGVEVVKRSGGVGRKWEGYSKTKYECISGLLGLNQCLQRQVCILRWQMAKNAIEAMDMVRKMEREVNEIESNAGVLEQAGVAATSGSSLEVSGDNGSVNPSLSLV